MKTKKTPLEMTAEQTNDIVGYFQEGLHAVKGEYRSKIVCTNPRALTGSINIDEATRSAYPDANRWDYAIEYDNETYFVEFHPAATGNVSEMMNKFKWLKSWLRTKAPIMNELKPKCRPAYYWIATGRVKILKGSSESRQLAQIGLIPQKMIVLD